MAKPNAFQSRCLAALLTCVGAAGDEDVSFVEAGGDSYYAVKFARLVCSIYDDGADFTSDEGDRIFEAVDYDTPDLLIEHFVREACRVAVPMTNRK